MKTACFGHSKRAIEHCVSEFLAHVRRMVVEFVVGRVLSRDGHGAAETASTDRLDEPTAYYLLHRHDFGLEKAPVGARILYAMACGLSNQALIRDRDLLVKIDSHRAAGEDGIDEETDADEEPAEDTGSGSKVKLKARNQRRGRSMGYEAPGGRPVPIIDRIHRLMHLWKGGDVQKVDEYLDQHGLRRHALFRRVLQSLIELSSPGSQERSLLESLSNHIGAKGRCPSGRGSCLGWTRFDTPLTLWGDCAMRREELLERISINPHVCFGKPCIRGRRIWVSLILDLLASGMSIEEVMKEYDLEREDVLACIAYGAEMSRERYVDIPAESGP